MKDSLRLTLLAWFIFIAAAAAQPPGGKPAPAATPLPIPTDKRIPPEIAPLNREKDDVKSPGASTPPGLVSPGSKQPSKTVAPAIKSVVDTLSEADLEQVIPLLRSHYFAPATLTETEIKRATVQGLLDRLTPGVSLLPAPPTGVALQAPFRSEIYENRACYIRLGAPGKEQLAELDAALKVQAEKGCPAIILDLRETPGSADFESAAEACRRFCPNGKTMFTVQRPGAKDQVYTSKEESSSPEVLVLLTDRETGGSGEIIAGVLQSMAGAMVIGEKTHGGAKEFSDLPLSDSKILRVASAEALLPTGSISEGIKPDVPVDVPIEETRNVLAQELEKGIGPLVSEIERPRMNEAALVAGTNPELEAMIAAQKTHAEKARGPLRDVALQRALDLVTSVAVFEKGLHPK